MNYKLQAKENLKEKWGNPVLGFILLAIAQSATNFLAILIMPINVGYARLHNNLTNKKQESLEDLLVGFTTNYFGNLLAMFLRVILIFLWTLLLIIPGIIKSVAYSLTEYILQDDDFKEDGYEAIKLSEKMMSGHKGELFILYLSFIGWLLLVPFTFGLLLLYVVPYISQTISVFYEERKKEYMAEHGGYHGDIFEQKSKEQSDDDFFYQ